MLALEEAIVESNGFQANLARFRGAAMRMDMPIIKGFGNGLVDPGGVIGTPNVGRCIFEDTRLEKLDDKLANCDVVLCASRWNADMLKAKTSKRVEIIYEGVDTTLFRPGPRPGLLDQSKFYIFSGGKVEYRKGHDLVLLAFKEFSRRHDDAVLVTAWHSPWPQLSVGFKGKLNAPLELAADGTIHVKKWVASNGINPDKVIEIKQIANPLMPGVLCDMDCALFPSRAEACTNLPGQRGHGLRHSRDPRGQYRRQGRHRSRQLHRADEAEADPATSPSAAPSSGASPMWRKSCRRSSGSTRIPLIVTKWAGTARRGFWRKRPHLGKSCAAVEISDNVALSLTDIF